MTANNVKINIMQIRKSDVAKHTMLIFVLIVLFSGCRTNSNNEIFIKSYEISENKEIVNANRLKEELSEYINIEYEGSQKYNLSYQVWSKEKLVVERNKIISIDLKEYAEFSFEMYAFDENGKLQKNSIRSVSYYRLSLSLYYKGQQSNT